MWYQSSCHASSALSSRIIQQEEVHLLEECIKGELDEAKRLVDSGVSVKCRDEVYGPKTYFLFCVVAYYCSTNKF